MTTITFNRVDEQNSITTTMYAAMADALAAAEQDASVRVVVFQGDVAIFSAGNDIGATFCSSPLPRRIRPCSVSCRLPRLPQARDRLGVRPGRGHWHHHAVPLRSGYAGDNAAFSMPFVNLGLCPEAASSLLVPQMLGYHRAAEALLLGEPASLPAALEVGLVNRVLPPTECNGGVAQAQAKLAAAPVFADRDQAPG